MDDVSVHKRFLSANKLILMDPGNLLFVVCLKRNEIGSESGKA